MMWGIGLLLFGAVASNPIFGPYKDTAVSMNWNTNEIGTVVRGSAETVLAALPAGVDAVSWSFASGKCGTETWSGQAGADLASANVKKWAAAGKKYIISTGGQLGHFTCDNDEGFATFVNRYQSSSMIGVDFDIEGSQTEAEIEQLVARMKVGLVQWPNMRWSWTLATLGTVSEDNMGTVGRVVMKVLAAQQAGWKNVFINLMVMNYGSAIPGVCTVVNGRCDMGLSAINAAETLHRYYGVPYSSIELTPMIGGNDLIDNVFTLADVEVITEYAKRVGLGGLHHWSLDRDVDCAAGSWASATCNSYGTAGRLGFTNAFIKALGTAAPAASPARSASPVSSSSPVRSASPVVRISPRAPSSSPRASVIGLSSPVVSPVRASPRISASRSTSPRSSPSRSPSPKSASPRPSPARLQSPSPLPPAPAGSCGMPWGVSCGAGFCCSAHGFCGQGDAYCKAGCQSAFGACDAAPTADTLQTKGRWLEPQSSMAVPSTSLRSIYLLISGGAVLFGMALIAGIVAVRSSLRCSAPEGIEIHLLSVTSDGERLVA